MTDSGEIIKQGRFDNHPAAVADFLGQHAGAGCAAVLEATRNWTVMHDLLEDVTENVTLAHPLKVRAIAEARVKTDKIDSTTLAHLLRCDLVPSAHVASPQARVVKNLVRHRLFLVRQQTMTKNRIHVLLDRYPQIRGSRSAPTLFTGSGRQWLRQVELTRYDRHLMDSKLDLLEHLQQQIHRIDGWLLNVGRQDPRVKQLMSIPGIGKFFGLLLVSEIDDIRRFRTPRKLHAYAGLVPSTYASGGKTFHGRIIKQSNKYIRWAMVEAVWPAICQAPTLAAYYHRLAARKGANSAKVATARKLLTIVFHVLKDQRMYHHVV